MPILLKMKSRLYQSALRANKGISISQFIDVIHYFSEIEFCNHGSVIKGRSRQSSVVALILKYFLCGWVSHIVWNNADNSNILNNTKISFANERDEERETEKQRYRKKDRQTRQTDGRAEGRTDRHSTTQVP